MHVYDFGAHVVSVFFTRAGGAFALSDGTVRWEDGATVQAHAGAALCACLHPSGQGLVTGGDEGRVVWSKPQGVQVLADVGGRWIDAVAASLASGLIAFAAGREAGVRDASDPSFERRMGHARSVADLAFDPKGRRLACATYGGLALWYARIADQTPQMLKWAGSHTGVVWSPDGRFLISAMQENALHGWRLADGRDLSMGGYPSKIRSLAFLAAGRMMATSGASGAVVWPFAGSNGPMGKAAVEVGADPSATVSRVAAAPGSSQLAAGLGDGRIWSSDLTGAGRAWIKAEPGAPISALAISDDGRRVAWGDEAGLAGVAELGRPAAP